MLILLSVPAGFYLFVDKQNKSGAYVNTANRKYENLTKYLVTDSNKTYYEKQCL